MGQRFRNWVLPHTGVVCANPQSLKSPIAHIIGCLIEMFLLPDQVSSGVLAFYLAAWSGSCDTQMKQKELNYK